MTNPTPPIPDNGWRERLKEIDQYARVLQESLCAYRTTEGDNRRCDCKYIGKPNGDFAPMTEISGCAEARAIIWHFQKLQQELHTAIEEEHKRFVEGLKQLEIYVTWAGEGHLEELIAKYSPSDKETTE